MELGRLKQRWRRGETAYGIWLLLNEPWLADAAASAGYDYACVDLQHGLADYRSAVGMIRALADTETTPIVRVPDNEPGLIGRVLDAGALGVVVPMVNTPEEAARAVEACRYTPQGSRSYGPLGAGVLYGTAYRTEANDAVACIPMIETREGVERADEILAVPGIDAVYVGPSDLSLTLGLPPRGDHDADVYGDALRRVLTECEKAGVVAGIHADAALAPKWHGAGFRMITVASDLGAATAGMRADLAASRGES
ncbi:MAG: aldolase/citrate lyase family protein [Actinomycetota bacterium]|nr:aldolase/citrate lyase family protein [Actinomycetota bacterium]